jgi:hypothetical protein
MSYNILRLCKWCLVAAALLAFGVPWAAGGNAPVVSGPMVSGSYEVVYNTDLGSQAQIRIRIHLVNHGPSDLSIQRMTFWDFSHPDKGGSHACAVALRAHASAETTQEFTIRRSDYQLWQKGFRPRFVLQMAGPGSTKSKAVVRLDRIAGRISGQEAK